MACSCRPAQAISVICRAVGRRLEVCWGGDCAMGCSNSTLPGAVTGQRVRNESTQAQRAASGKPRRKATLRLATSAQCPRGPLIEQATELVARPLELELAYICLTRYRDMKTAKLSSKGQVVLPSVIRHSRQWPPGTEFAVLETPEGVLLKPLAAASPFAPTQLADVFRSARYAGPRKSLQDMDAAVMSEAAKQRRQEK